MKIDLKEYPNNACYCKKLKVGQDFKTLSGGYLQKNFKHIRTQGITHLELEEGKENYDNLLDRKNVIRLSKHNLIRYIAQEMKEENLSIESLDDCIMRMMKSKKYNFCYVLGIFKEYEINNLVRLELEPDNMGPRDLYRFFYKPDPMNPSGVF